MQTGEAGNCSGASHPVRWMGCCLLLAAFLLLGGCGQKGPLYLPDEDSGPTGTNQPNQPSRQKP